MATRVALALLICSLANAASAAVPSVGPGHEGVRLELIADGFGVLSNGAAPGGERDVVYLLEQHEGRVVLVENGSVAGRPVLELAGQLIEDTWNEEGLVGVALPPDDPSTLFVSYVDRRDHLVVSRFRLLDDGRRADPDSETVLLRVPREARIHHCGHLEFGPHDGRLYLCIGDMQSNEGEITSVSQDTAGCRARSCVSIHGSRLR